MKKMACPHCSVPFEQLIASEPDPVYNPFEDEFHHLMCCLVCEGQWIRVYKPSHDIKEE